MGVDHCRNALDEKYRQMAHGRCNIIAINMSKIVNDIAALERPIIKYLQEKSYNKISAVILIKDDGISRMDTVGLYVQKYKKLLINNPDAETEVPHDLISSFTGL